MGSGMGRSRRASTVACALALASLLVLVLAGCNQAGAAPATRGDVNSVHILRTSGFPANHLPPLDQTVADAAKAQKLYDAVQALPPAPDGEFACPADFDEAYHLTFYRDQTVVSWAVVKPDGCRAVTLPHGRTRWSVNTDQFWADFADTLGIPESALFPTPGPDGPSAPTEIPGQP